jgi:hypothetical protein
MIIFNGLLLIMTGLTYVSNYFTRTRMYIALGLILINIAVILSYLHKKSEMTITHTQPILVSSLQKKCPICGKPLNTKAAFCSVCGHKRYVEAS